MGNLRLVVLDVLKPHNPSILELSSTISDLKGIDGVDISVYEIDSKVENVKVTILGENIDYIKVRATIEDLGASVHSIDKVSSGRQIVEEAQTHQDA
ncbi:hypothetical protein GF358_00370 [Candidatus Woesearchaeota archaeon]|nr:hypothetical protein [Candidatus Woesearchaeota archaeon]